MKFITVAALAGLAVASPLVELEERVTCPTGGDLPPNYVKPYFVEVSKKDPDCEFGFTKQPYIDPNNFGVAVGLNLPPSAWDKTCKLVFLFPDHEQTKNYFYYNGGGHFLFSGQVSTRSSLVAAQLAN